ncbi:WALL-ASSOCIATED RECEPTOR KINASE-LIKE 21 [Salix koriyanagi]|uniref:WALL-ASSOCIATED RECEPTOR KINASE-LIKE 21 n=1 Tax=Salix koriyanagi TaxID=2511006 RepID=A0A9Q0SLD7_9ROSI|nr:WALL-ASSOCIATED RECEPTOR KINASE-LIKE 21 [Salix koriyanagi]
MSGKCGGTTRVVVLVGGIIVGASLMAALALLCYFVRQKSTSMRNRSSAKRLLCEAAGNSSVPFFQYKEIEKATNGFSEKQRLGTGAYDPYLETCRDAWTLSSIHSVAELAFRCLAFHGDMRPTMMEVAEELEQIRVSAWAPTMYMLSPSSSSHSSDHGSQKSLGVSIGKKAGVASRRLIVSQRTDYLTLEEVKDSSPVSVQDPWLSEQSSPSTNSLLGNVVH